MLVYCGKTVQWIKMPLGMEVGLGPGGIMLDGEPALHGRVTSATVPQQWAESGDFSAHFASGPFCSGTVAHLTNC